MMGTSAMQPIRVPAFDVEAGSGTLHVTRPAEWDLIWKVYGEFPWTTVDIRMRGEFDEIRRAVDALAVRLAQCSGQYEDVVDSVIRATSEAVEHARQILS